MNAFEHDNEENIVGEIKHYEQLAKACGGDATGCGRLAVPRAEEITMAEKSRKFKFDEIEHCEENCVELAHDIRGPRLTIRVDGDNMLRIRTYPDGQGNNYIAFESDQWLFTVSQEQGTHSFFIALIEGLQRLQEAMHEFEADKSKGKK